MVINNCGKSDKPKYGYKTKVDSKPKSSDIKPQLFIAETVLINLMTNFKTIFIAILITFNSCTIERNVDFEKYELLTTAKEVSEFYKINLDTSGNSETAFVKKWNDGSYDFTYTYDLANSDNNKKPLYYSIDISGRNSEKEAVGEFNSTKLLFKNSWISGTNENIVEYDSVVSSGDQNFYAVRNYKNQPNGVFLIYRKNKIIYSLISSGYLKNDHSFIKDLIEPEIKHLDQFKLKN